jgi:hypothetical protein
VLERCLDKSPYQLFDVTAAKGPTIVTATTAIVTPVLLATQRLNAPNEIQHGVVIATHPVDGLFSDQQHAAFPSVIVAL